MMVNDRPALTTQPGSDIEFSAEALDAEVLAPGVEQSKRSAVNNSLRPDVAERACRHLSVL